MPAFKPAYQRDTAPTASTLHPPKPKQKLSDDLFDPFGSFASQVAQNTNSNQPQVDDFVSFHWMSFQQFLF